MTASIQAQEINPSQARQERLRRHKVEALQLAHDLRERLLTSFGASDVVICGSVKGAAPWHEQSDLDLAVSGLPQSALEIAFDELSESLPAWLKLDLIPCEQAPADFMTRLLEDIQMGERSVYVALAQRLQDEVAGLTRLHDGLLAALTQLHAEERDGPLDEFSTRGLATYLDDFYSGCERVFERIAVTLDEGVSEGGQWHRKLLGQMAEHGGNDRPPLLSGELTLELDEYRRFRHRLRHLYGYELSAVRVLELARHATPLFEDFCEAVSRFIGWLEQKASQQSE